MVNEIVHHIDLIVTNLTSILEKIMFFSIGGIPLIIIWVLSAGIFFIFRFKFINIRGFIHAIKIGLGLYDDEIDQEDIEGEVTPRQALATALSASLGLGNIAGVAIAIQTGGAGAVLWMTLAGILGMSNKFVECTLGVKYRIINPDGTIAGGPMYYLSQGLEAKGLPRLGKFLGIFIAICCMGSALGACNMFQVNQSFEAISSIIPGIENYNWVYGLLSAFGVGIIIIGGISRIGIVTSQLAPLMLGIYLFGSFWVILANASNIPLVFHQIIDEAFNPKAVEGGIIGVFVQGIRRGIFSNGGGLGGASIVHAVAKTKFPIKEGIVSVLEPFIDTVVVCNLTALVILSAGISTNSDFSNLSGSSLAVGAFAETIHWFPLVLTVLIFLFALSTMITWSYNGEQAWGYIFGNSTTIVFKLLFTFFVFLGSVVNLKTVLDFSDIMVLGMAIPNLIGCIILSPEVAQDLQDYWEKLRIEKIIQKEKKSKVIIDS